MKLPSESSSSETLVNYTIYTVVRVAANPDTKKLAIPLTADYETLETKFEDRKKKARESASMIAMRDEKNDKFDTTIMNLSLEILSHTGNNREDVRYKNLFSKTPSSITSLPIKDKLNNTKVLGQKLISNKTDAIYAKHLSLIQTAMSELGQAELNYETSQINEQGCYDFEKSAQAALRETLVKTYGKLIELKGKKEAEKYFKKTTGKRKETKLLVPTAES